MTDSLTDAERPGPADSDDPAELRRRIALLEEANRNHAQFLGAVSHEVGNLLLPFHMILQVSRSGKAATADAMLEMLPDHVPAMMTYLERLRKVSRDARGKFEFNMTRLELAGLVDRAASAVRSSLEERGQRLDLSKPSRPVEVQGDPTHLESAILELLHNASENSSEGAGITVSLEAGEYFAAVRVRDLGRGISREALPRVFDLFWRDDDGIDFAAGHFGAGLPLVRLVAERHGGRVEARSDGPGRGSEFTIILPIAQPA